MATTSACNFIQGIRKLPLSLKQETDSIFTQDADLIKITWSLKYYFTKDNKRQLFVTVHKAEIKRFVHYKESNYIISLYIFNITYWLHNWDISIIILLWTYFKIKWIVVTWFENYKISYIFCWMHNWMWENCKK